jgi:hypothetical protein
MLPLHGVRRNLEHIGGRDEQEKYIHAVQLGRINGLWADVELKMIVALVDCCCKSSDFDFDFSNSHQWPSSGSSFKASHVGNNFTSSLPTPTSILRSDEISS